MAKNIKILLVDDDVLSLREMARQLEEAGYDVEQSENGEGALQKLATVPGISVVILDRQMPRMDGVGVLKIMKENPTWRNIPVIIQNDASKYEQDSIVNMQGVHGYLTKPYGIEELVALIRRALKNLK